MSKGNFEEHKERRIRELRIREAHHHLSGVRLSNVRSFYKNYGEK